jgi:hypothetical protein
MRSPLLGGTGPRLETQAATSWAFDSMDRRKRPMPLVSGHPKQQDLVMGLGRFRPSGSLSLGWRPSRERARTQRAGFQEVVPRSGASPVRRPMS